MPDLGADLVRIYRVDNVERTVKDHEPLVVTPGSGPRHLAFAVQEDATFMYLVSELGNTVVGYEVSYGEESVMFEEIWSTGTHGPEKKVPEGAQASEIMVSVSALSHNPHPRQANSHSLTPTFSSSLRATKTHSKSQTLTSQTAPSLPPIH